MGKLIRWGQPNQTNIVRPGEWIVPQKEAAEPLDPRLAFWALTPELIAGDTMKGVLVGTGDLTTAVSTTQYCADDNGVYNLFGVNKPVWSGGIASLTGGPGTEVLDVKAGAGEAPYLQYYPGATNLLPYSRTYTDASWVNNGTTTSQTIVGLDGTANGGAVIASTGAAANRFYTTSNTAVTGYKLAVLWYRKSDSTSVHALFEFYPNLHIEWNAVTGAFISETGGIDYEIIDYGDIVKILVGRTGVTANGAFGLYPDRTNSTGSVGLLQVELYDDKQIPEVRGLGPIFTTTGSASTVALAYDNNVANHAESGCYYMEIIKDGQGAILDGFLSVISPNYQLDDGLVVVTQTWTDNTEQKLGIAFADGQMAVNVGGVWGTDGVFAGTLLNGALDYFRSGLISSRLRNVRRYDETDYTEAKSIIDGLMAP